MPSSNICVSTKPLGIQHPYSYCVKPSSEMVSKEVTSGGLTMKNTGRVLGGLFNYVDYLTVNADSATAEECLDTRGSALIGNRYVLKTNIKCRRINENTGATISGDYYLHKYIDNATTLGGLITGGRPLSDVTGLIPSTFASAGKIGGNVMDIVSSFSGDTNPYCMKVNLQCHVIDSKRTANNYRGFSPDVYLSLDDIEDIDQSLFIYGFKPNIPAVQEEQPAPEQPAPPFPSTTSGSGSTTSGTGSGSGSTTSGTDSTTSGTGSTTSGTDSTTSGTGSTTSGTDSTTLGTGSTTGSTTGSATSETGSTPGSPPNEQFTNFIENIIYQNSDKIQNSRDFETVINQINFQDEFLVKTYYVGFSILIIILIFKLINKK